jgi:uncharacterized protein YdeI (YjbR/CyaY-like superfamily)
MLPKDEPIEGIPVELEKILETDYQANDFFETLSKFYKKGYCDWVNSTTHETTRQQRAEKAHASAANTIKEVREIIGFKKF